MAFVNGQWVNQYDKSNWSFGPGGGQGLFNPDRSKVYWSGGTPSFQAPTQSSIDPITGKINPGGPGSTAPGWTGQQQPPPAGSGNPPPDSVSPPPDSTKWWPSGTPGWATPYNPLNSYNPTTNPGNTTNPSNTTNPTDINNTIRTLASYFPLNQYYPNQNMPTDPAGGTGRYAPSPFGQQPPSGGGFNYYNYGQ